MNYIHTDGRKDRITNSPFKKKRLIKMSLRSILWFTAKYKKVNLSVLIAKKMNRKNKNSTVHDNYSVICKNIGQTCESA